MAVKYSIEYNNFNCFSYCHLCWWKLEFKNFLPIRIRTHLDEQRVDGLHVAAAHVDNFFLMNIVSFGKQYIPKPVVANILIPGDCFIL